MKTATDFSVVSSRPATETDGPMLALLNGPLGKQIEVPGAWLNGQFTSVAGWLLLTTENVPYEEALHCLLFDGSTLQQIDHLELSNSMTPGAIADLVVEPEDSLSFSFFGGDRWRLTVKAVAQRTLFSREPGVHWPGASPLSKHYLTLSRLSARGR